jgi:general stress protein 26
MDADTNPVELLKQLLADIEFAMLTSRARDGALDSRPVQVLQIDADAAIWLFTNAASDKVDEIGCDAHVNLAFADTSRKRFASLAGNAEIIVDAHKIDELWTPAQTIFFPRGRADPSLVLLKVVPDSARYWDGNESALGMLLKFGKAVLRGEPSDLGSSGRVDLRRK